MRVRYGRNYHLFFSIKKMFLYIWCLLIQDVVISNFDQLLTIRQLSYIFDLKNRTSIYRKVKLEKIPYKSMNPVVDPPDGPVKNQTRGYST